MVERLAANFMSPVMDCDQVVQVVIPQAIDLLSAVGAGDKIGASHAGFREDPTSRTPSALWEVIKCDARNGSVRGVPDCLHLPAARHPGVNVRCKPISHGCSPRCPPSRVRSTICTTSASWKGRSNRLTNVLSCLSRE